MSSVSQCLLTGRTVTKIAVNYFGSNFLVLGKLVRQIGSAGRSLTRELLQGFCENISSKPALFQRFPERSLAINHIIYGNTVFLGSLHKCLLQRTISTIVLVYNIPLFLCEGLGITKNLFKILVSCVSTLCENLIQIVGKVSPKLGGLIRVTEDDFKSLHPSGADRILDRIDGVIEGSCFLCSLKSLQRKFIETVSKSFD